MGSAISLFVFSLLARAESFRLDDPRLPPALAVEAIQGSARALRIATEIPPCFEPGAKVMNAVCASERVKPVADALGKSWEELRRLADQAARATTPERVAACVASYELLWGAGKAELKAFDARIARGGVGSGEILGWLDEKQGGREDAVEEILTAGCGERFPAFPGRSPNDLVAIWYLKSDPDVHSSWCQEGKPTRDARTFLASARRAYATYASSDGYGDLIAPLRGGFDIQLHLPRVDSQRTSAQYARNALESAWGLKCQSREQSASDIPCACAVEMASNRFESALRRVERQQAESLARLRDYARERYELVVRTGPLSNVVKKALLARALDSFPPLYVNPTAELNASYSTPPVNAFQVYLPLLSAPEAMVKDVFDHEVGHYFQYMIESPEIQALLKKSDVAKLESLRDCLDRNIVKGEFRTEALEDAFVPMRPERVLEKRVEALADTFARAARARGSDSDPSSPSGVATLSCPKLREVEVAIAQELWREEMPASDPSVDRHSMDGHARPSWRIPVLVRDEIAIRERVPGVRRPERCEEKL